MPSSKNIIVCLDGTWSNAISGVSGSTNVHEIHLSLNPSNQCKFYRPGVGADRGWFGRWLDGATGKGTFRLAREGWEHIHANFEPGAKIFIFGFSRGAYAARSLASMIVRRGVIGWQGSLEEEFREWMVEIPKPSLGVKQTVHFLGLFDCVPGNQFYMLRDRSFYLNSGELENGILHFRHAVSRNERRWSFRPLLFI